MSEWDYLPTPYENLVSSEEKHSILLLLSLACLSQGKVVQPFEIFELVENNELIANLIEKEVEKVGVLGLMRTLLQYEDVRSEKKRDKIIGLINSYQNAKRNRTKDL
jgi:hypothetical protein